MTANNSLKRRIRNRMLKSGESYTTARRAILGLESEPDHSKAETLKVALAQPESRTGDVDQDVENLLRDYSVPSCDVLVLPELIGGHGDPLHYERLISELAKRLSCHVVGGSCYTPGPDGLINAGIVADKRGQVVCRYEKLRPYGSENDAGVANGTQIGRFEVEGRSFVVVICSDLWFSETITSLESAPDVVLIPSFAITQRDEPDKARELWRHMLVARAYEHSAYVGVCDWAYPCEFEGLRAAGVSGFADPRPNGESFFLGNRQNRIQSYELDFTRLDEFRANRKSRGFSRQIN